MLKYHTTGDTIQFVTNTHAVPYIPSYTSVAIFAQPHRSWLVHEMPWRSKCELGAKSRLAKRSSSVEKRSGKEKSSSGKERSSNVETTSVDEKRGGAKRSSSGVMMSVGEKRSVGEKSIADKKKERSNMRLSFADARNKLRHEPTQRSDLKRYLDSMQRDLDKRRR